MALTTEPTTEITEPRPRPLAPEPAVPLPPDSIGYRIKNRVLGRPLHSEELEHERLGRPTALAVFASDNLSSSAYATEEILRVLVPAVGLAAFSLVVPLTVAMLVVLGFLILSYRQTIKAYPTAGGAYMVTRDNFGVLPAQVAGVALLTDYVLTVSVSVAAGTAALTSAFAGLGPLTVPIAVAFIGVIALGNLRGVRESGKVFAVPTYFFMANMALLLGWGLVRWASGDLPRAVHGAEGMLPLGHSGNGLLMGASLFVVLHAFASGGAAVTGVEAISNGVPAFRKPAWKNARSTLVVMGTCLGLMFLGLSALAAHMHVAPFEEGTPTVISQVGELVYGGGVAGRALYYCLQAGTMLILVLAANTSFADFPRLASFHAGDNFMPRQLTKRGHRLVFSNGIIFLSVAATALVLVTGAQVDRLIPLYAIGVFTSFTLSQAGMAKHHLVHREPGWRFGLFVNGTGAVLSLIVDVIIAVTKFTHGAWVIVVLVPVMVLFLMRLARQYEQEADQLEHDVPQAIAAGLLRRHVVCVFIDRLDLAAARALQYGRSLRPDDLRAVHFVIDEQRGEELAEAWGQHGLSAVSLELVNCPDRRLTRTAVRTVAHALQDGDTEVTVLLPDRLYGGPWHRLLHDQTGDALIRDISLLPHTNVTLVPFQLSARPRHAPSLPKPRRREPEVGHPSGDGHRAARGPAPIADVRWRHRVTVVGRVESLRVQPVGGAPTLECLLSDQTGSVSVVFLGRRRIAGIRNGARLEVTGMAVDHHGRLAIINPEYRLLTDAAAW
jgi:amino acid transporter